MLFKVIYWERLDWFKLAFPSFYKDIFFCGKHLVIAYVEDFVK